MPYDCIVDWLVELTTRDVRRAVMNYTGRYGRGTPPECDEQRHRFRSRSPSELHRLTHRVCQSVECRLVTSRVTSLPSKAKIAWSTATCYWRTRVQSVAHFALLECAGNLCRRRPIELNTVGARALCGVIRCHPRGERPLELRGINGKLAGRHRAATESSGPKHQG